MAVHFVIYKEHQLVVSIGEGRVTFDQVRVHQDRLLEDPDFSPEFNQLLDGTRTTNYDLSADEIRIVVNRKLFSPNSRRAVVVSSKFMYGMGRMVQTYLELSREASPMSVFHDRPSALKWLGLENVPALAEAEIGKPDTATGIQESKENKKDASS